MLRRFLKLPADRRRLFIQAFFLQSVIALGLRFTRFRTLRRWLARISRWRIGSACDGAASRSGVAWAVTSSGRYLGTASTCLTAALTAEALLHRQGCSARVIIGVQPPDEGRLRAHAWVDSEGSVVVGGPAASFAVLAVLGGHATPFDA